MRKGHDTAAGAGLSVEVRREGHRPVLVVRGEIDLSTAATFRDAVEDVLEGQHCLELDLRDTTFMDSSGLAVLIAAHRRLGRHREAVVVRSPAPIVRRLLDISGVGQIVDVRAEHERHHGT